MRRTALPIAIFLFSAITSFAQSLPTIFEALESVRGESIDWDPSWPPELPPDAFAASGTAPASIRVIVESAEEERVFEALWTREGRLSARPLFAAGSAFAASFGYDRNGLVSSYRLRSMDADASAAGPGVEGSSVVLARDPEGKLESAAAEADGATIRYSYSRAGSQWEELGFDEEGTPVERSRFILAGAYLHLAQTIAEDGSTETLMRLERDASGRVTELERAGSEPAEAVYDRERRPVMMRSASGERRFQWDERGLLVREHFRGADGYTVERRYDYSFDASGIWLERRSIEYTPRFGAMVPGAGSRIIRKIIYR